MNNDTQYRESGRKKIDCLRKRDKISVNITREIKVVIDFLSH